MHGSKEKFDIFFITWFFLFLFFFITWGVTIILVDFSWVRRFKGACFLANTINPIPPNNETLDLGKLSNNVFLKGFVKMVFQKTSKAIPFQI